MKILVFFIRFSDDNFTNSCMSGWPNTEPTDERPSFTDDLIHVTFTRSGASGAWDYIKFQSSGTISYATIEYAPKGVWTYSDNVTAQLKTQATNTFVACV